MSDLIRRQDALSCFHDWVDQRGDVHTADEMPEYQRIEQLPDAQPKTGKWINGHWDGDSNFRIDGRGNCWYVRECSNCHEEIKGKPTKYCPECGAKMEGEEHD